MIKKVLEFNLHIQLNLVKLIKKPICQSLKLKRDCIRVICLCIQINMQVNSRPWQTTMKTTQEGGDREMGSDKSESGNEWTRVRECNRGRWFLLTGLGLSVPASLRSSDIHQVCLSLCLTAGLQRVLFFSNQASPTAGTAPDKGPIWRGFLCLQTSAGKRLRWTNERFCGGKSRAWRSTRQTEREEINKR